MLKAKLGSDTMLIGLSARNVELLKEGKPIAIDGAIVGFPGMKVMIMYGETEQAMMAELNAAINTRH